MNIQIAIGGIRFHFKSDFEITVEESMTSFLCTKERDRNVYITFVCDNKKAVIPDEPMSGSDLLMEYYQKANQTICLAKGGVTGPLATSTCNSDFTEIECRLHFVPKGRMKFLGSLIRFIPMCSILQKNDVVFLHASQIEINGKGILFTAPSGTGKTTQAKLWKNLRNAEMICNDRTLISKRQTYGYPVDGSEPVMSGKTHPLGAIVYLEQADGNSIKLLRPKDCLRNLLPQMVIDTWDSKARVLAMEQILDLIEVCPIYQLNCTPDETSILCLENQLIMDGVI